ncbi:hypothetical protein ATO6_04630 [Oceanicola sp. 22II-s10i]|uniref:MaoC family dehydratase n=1 Tax=Oceanicola sp. 22II-s10i TaxID=1317116 RepID=UPI000B524620|nr:MaoC family dehydratase [Oceanicola sp. 22II-s10i]OWU86146.1 hypothetical protein ATO6_04630 [Oceanicola sp. 22II-s10i]
MTVKEFEPYAGFKYAERRFVPNAEDEKRLLGICGIDPMTFGGGLDPATFITLAIEEQVRNGVPSSGAVNMVQWLEVRDLPKFDEEVTVTGGIVEVKEVPRGTTSEAEATYHGSDGRLCLRTGRVSLRTDPKKYADPKLRGAGKRPDPVIADPEALEVIEHIQLTPDIVSAYSLKTTNPIHNDMDAANRAGYRAPIIGGAHGVRYLTAAIWRQFAPKHIRMDIRFRRPIHWDDAFDVRVEGAGEWSAICLSRDGKVLVEMAISELVPGK